MGPWYTLAAGQPGTCTRAVICTSSPLAARLPRHLHTCSDLHFLPPCSQAAPAPAHVQ